MKHNEGKYRELNLFLALAAAGVVAALFHVHIPHTEVLIDGRWAFGFMGFALLRDWWAALGLVALLSLPYGTPDIPLWIGFVGNMLYAVPSLLVIRPLSGWIQRCCGPGWFFGLGWGALVLLCYQVFITPVVWGVSSLIESRSVGAGLIDGWRTQPFLVESALVALFSAVAMVVVLAIKRLHAQRQRLEHMNSVLLSIRNVNQLIVNENDPERLIERACVNLTESTGYQNALIALLGGETGRALGLSGRGETVAVASAGFNGGFEAMRERLERGEFSTCMKRTFETGDTIVTDDTAADCPDCPLSGGYGGCAGLARSLVFEGVTYGILTASVPRNLARDAEEQNLFNEVADDLAFALHKMAVARRHKQSEQRLGLVIEGSGLGTWEWNVHTNETVFNEQWAAMLGYTIEELTPYDYATWERLVHPEDLDRSHQALTDCVEGRTADYECEFRMKHKDGHWVWILDQGRVMTRGDTGKPLAMFGTHTNITEIKKAEEKARTEHDLSQNIIVHGPVGITIVNRDGVVESANRMAEEILGLSRSAIHGRTYNDADWKITAVDGTQFPDEQLPVRRVLHTGEAVHGVQHAIEWPSGQRRILSVNAAPLKNREGRIERIVCAVEDITERKQAEETLRRNTELLNETGDMARVGGWELDLNTNTVFWTHTTRVIHEVPEDYVPTLEAAIDFFPDAKGELTEAIRRAREEGVPYDVEVPFVTAKGRKLWTHTIGQADFRDGKCVRLHGTFQDITERRNAEIALQRSEARYKRLAENAPAVVFQFRMAPDGAFSFPFITRSVEAVMGVPPDDVKRDAYALLDLIDPGQREAFQEAVLESARNVSPYEQELQVRRKGEPGWVMACASPECQPDGSVLWDGFFQDITERKKAEEALRESEQRLSLATRSAALGIWDWDVVNNRMTWDDQMFRLYGITDPPESYGVEIWKNGLHPDDRDFAWEACQAALSGEKEYDIEFRVRWPDGTVRHVKGQGIVLRDDARNPVRMLGINSDITARKRMERQHQVLASIIERSRDFIGVADMRKKAFFVNPAGQELVGLEGNEEVARTKIEDYFLPEDIPFVNNTIFPTVMREGRWAGEFRFRHFRSGKAVPVLYDLFLSEDPSTGEMTNYSTVTRDISERKQSESTLRAAERRNQALLDHSPACHKIVDLDFNLQYMSKNGFQMLKLEENANVYGKPYPFDFFPEAFQQGMKDCLEQVRTTGKTITFEALANDIKGNDVWLYSTLVPVLNDDGKLDFITVVTADLTQEKRLENDLRQSQKMESVGQLAGGVAHDFNNMLNVILGHTELALDDLAADSPLRDDLEEIRKAAKRSANLTRQLLAFARKETVKPKVLDLNETIASMLKMLERLIGEDIELFWKPGTRLALVRVDPGQVDQMLANLAVNARDAIGHQNGRVTIETANAFFDEDYCAHHAGFTPGDYVMLAVSDDGCGMDEETRAQIFEPFFTTKGVGEGTGLGLATLYGIVKQNEGFINVYSEPDRGTTFRIYLPAIDAESFQQDDARSTAAAAAGGNETILIVEDERAILKMTRAMLERLGYTVLTASTPSDAIRTVREHRGRIDLVITDVVMPEMNGRDLAKSLQESCPSIRALFMSGYTANVIAHQGVLDEGVNFIQKPFSREQLAVRVREALEG